MRSPEWRRRTGESILSRDTEISAPRGAAGCNSLSVDDIAHSILVLSLSYRTNVDFAVEDIETLLSSRFIDEDFFRPTIARYTSHVTVARDPSLQDDVARPGSLPISAAFRPRDLGHEPVDPDAMESSPDATRRRTDSAVPRRLPPDQPQRKSYGDLTAPSQTPSVPSEAPRPETPLTAPVPVPGSLSRPPLFAGSSASSSRYGSAGVGDGGPLSDAAVAGSPASAIRGGGDPVEPAFISLSRARRTSFGGSATGSGIQRASPISRSPSALDSGGTADPLASGPAALPSQTPISGSLPRRISLTSSGASGSPIFRPGSYISNSPSQGYGYGHAYSYSGSGTGIIRQHPISGSPSSQSFGISRSPLAGPPTFPGGASGPAAAPRPIAASVRTPSYTGVGGGYGSQGSYTASRSYGRTGSSGGSAEWTAGGAAGPGGPESLSRRSTASRLSFGAAGSPAVGAYSSGRSSRLGTMMRQHDEGRFPLSQPSSSAPASTTVKRFVNGGRAPEDAAEIEDFLSMLDSKPDLRALDSSRSFPTSSSARGAGAGARSVVVSKRDIDEQLRLLKSSVFGSISGPSGESPSPPAFTTSSAGAAGMSASPRGPSGLSALRRQTSRLSIEEHPAEELAAEAAATDAHPLQDDRPAPPPRLSPPQQGLAPYETTGSGLDRTPRGGYRSLKRDVLVSPTLSATSSSTALPAPPPLSSESPLHLEPRYLPLPTSSANSPLASPRNQQHYGAPFTCAVPPSGQPYPPLPYPPSSVAAPDPTPTGPISLGPYSSHASRQPIGPPRVGGGPAGTGGFGLSTIDSERTSMAASVSSLSTRGDGDGEQDGGDSYRGEEEAVGRLELDDSPALSLDADARAQDPPEQDSDCHRGRSHWTGLARSSIRSSAAADRDDDNDDDDDIASLAAAAYRHSRDPTPAARQPPSPGYFTSNPRRSRSRGRGAPHGMSPPDMPWMA